MITGVDLVEWQLRVASGEPIPLTQEQLALDGHAIEARIYAEDPDNGFLPSTGRLLHLAPPSDSDHVRVDTGVEQGDVITPYYDPMIAKLIVWDRDREGALTRLRNALGQYRIVGVQNNVEFLARLVDCPAFSTADLDTALIEREQALLFPESPGVADEAWLLAALAELLQERAQHERDAVGERGTPWNMRDGWRLNGQGRQTITLRVGEDERTVGAVPKDDGWDLALGELTIRASGSLGPHGEIHAQLGDRRMSAAVVMAGERRHVFVQGRSFPMIRVDPLNQRGEGDESGGELRSPMPGKIVSLLAEVGATIDKGAPLLVMEAMKMEHTLVAPARGVVKAFLCAAGDQVADGIELVAFEVVS
jgi:3-methylcrotonyl-CoA carboxylase alpha subunit